MLYPSQAEDSSPEERLHCIDTGPLRAVIFAQLAVTEQPVVNQLMGMDFTASAGRSGPGSLTTGIRPGPEQSPNRICVPEPLPAHENSALKWSSEEKTFTANGKTRKALLLVSLQQFSPAVSVLHRIF